MTNLTIRHMIRADILKICAIEALCFDSPWTVGDFIRCQRQRNCMGQVACIGPVVVGYIIYEVSRDRIEILNLGVSPFHHRLGIGRALVERQQGKLTHERRQRITLTVRETNLEALLFFKSLGFLATQVIRDFYEDTSEDAYLMQFRIGSGVTI